MNIFLENQLDKEIQECYRSLPDIWHNLNTAYINEQSVSTALWENKLANLLKNVDKISQYRKRN